MYTTTNGDVNGPKIIKHIFIGFIALIIIFGSFGTVSTGQVGIKTTASKVSGIVNPGVYLKVPFIQGVEKMDVQTQKEQTNATAASKDLQTVNAVVAINYNIDAAKASDLYSRVGVEYKSKVIDPAIQEVVKAATAQYTAEELITKRPEVTEKIQSSLSERLASTDINVTSVSIVNFEFSPTFNAAIEAKVTAEQNALAAKNKLDQVKYEAEQTVASAEATAKSIQLQSQAANNEKYIQLKALDVQAEAIKKWNGQLPTQMVPGGSVPFINLTK